MGREGLESGKKLNGHNGVRHRGGCARMLEMQTPTRLDSTRVDYRVMAMVCIKPTWHAKRQCY